MAQQSSTADEPELQGTADEQDPLDVLDLPQLYQKPSVQVLVSVLADLSAAPLSWDATANDRPQRRKITSEGTPAYLTKIVSSPLAWIGDDEEKERIWELASQRLSERSGRSGMGDITRTFTIPLAPTARSEPDTSSPTSKDECIEITLHEPAMQADNLGLKTWAASYLLAKRLPSLRPHFFPTRQPQAAILELGSGTGLVGLAAAAMFKTHVILTDLPEIVPNLERNLQANTAALERHGGSAETAVLDWSQPSNFSVTSAPNTFALILSADPIYSPAHPQLLVQAIDYHLSKTKEARVVIELPLRDAYVAERRDMRERMAKLGLELVDEGEEVGYDDWTSGDELTEVRCWWGVWGWAEV
ncbi:Protein-lysine N-methyltransferase rrg1 [Vermiconidia calcicola]|uniref:Protein-lysine N-methyltransferase rrg1 n=1 Tax=Vermiconidia calcicola TaxID=1690605 RepID=A0ACC3NUS1_9PEZI|nr:Protein-lysine N-methyltransferase rrg1 [Vermiconidia calcicola]